MGHSRDYAWDAAGVEYQTAYLVVSGTPQSLTDSFDITLLNNDGGSLTLVEADYGTAPFSDPNSLAPHGIFDTYYEVYAFNFDGAETDIFDTQPGETGMGRGYVETFDITINSVTAGVHFDLFTMEGDGAPEGYAALIGNLNAFAPFSHDAAAAIPEPTAALVFFCGPSRRGEPRSPRVTSLKSGTTPIAQIQVPLPLSPAGEALFALANR